MQFFRIVAAILFIFAALSAFGFGVHWQLDTTLGLIACGLLALVLAHLPPTL